MVLPRNFYIGEPGSVTDSLEADHLTLHLRSDLKHESEVRNADFSFMRKIYLKKLFLFRYNNRESKVGFQYQKY